MNMQGSQYSISGYATPTIVRWCIAAQPGRRNIRCSGLILATVLAVEFGIYVQKVQSSTLALKRRVVSIGTTTSRGYSSWSNFRPMRLSASLETCRLHARKSSLGAVVEKHLRGTGLEQRFFISRRGGLRLDLEMALSID